VLRLTGHSTMGQRRGRVGHSGSATTYANHDVQADDHALSGTLASPSHHEDRASRRLPASHKDGAGAIGPLSCPRVTPARGCGWEGRSWPLPLWDFVLAWADGTTDAMATTDLAFHRPDVLLDGGALRCVWRAALRCSSGVTHAGTPRSPKRPRTRAARATLTRKVHPEGLIRS